MLGGGKTPGWQRSGHTRGQEGWREGGSLQGHDPDLGCPVEPPKKHCTGGRQGSLCFSLAILSCRRTGPPSFVKSPGG